MRIIARFSKGDRLRFISHLDLQRLMQRALRRAMIPIKYSQGFNPHPLLSFASALSVGYTGAAECMDIRLEGQMPPQVFMDAVNAALPCGARVTNAIEAEEGLPSLTALLTHADYDVDATFMEPVNEERVRGGVNELMSDEIQVLKRTKSGMKQVDIRPMLMDMRVLSASEQSARLKLRGVLNASGGLNVELLMKAYARVLGVDAACRVHRACLYFDRIEV